MVNATRGEDLHNELNKEIIRRATTGGIDPLWDDPLPRALAGKLAATVAAAEVPPCHLLNMPMLCLGFFSSTKSVVPISAEGGNDIEPDGSAS